MVNEPYRVYTTTMGDDVYTKRGDVMDMQNERKLQLLRLKLLVTDDAEKRNKIQEQIVDCLEKRLKYYGVSEERIEFR